MQAISTTIVTGPNTHRNLFKAVADEAKNIGTNGYISISLVVMIISLTAWFITFKVNAEASIRALTDDAASMKIELKELKTSLPSKDWLELKFENLEAQLSASKKMGK